MENDKNKPDTSNSRSGSQSDNAEDRHEWEDTPEEDPGFLESQGQLIAPDNDDDDAAITYKKSPSELLAIQKAASPKLPGSVELSGLVDDIEPQEIGESTFEEQSLPLDELNHGEDKSGQDSWLCDISNRRNLVDDEPQEIDDRSIKEENLLLDDFSPQDELDELEQIEKETIDRSALLDSLSGEEKLPNSEKKQSLSPESRDMYLSPQEIQRMTLESSETNVVREEREDESAIQNVETEIGFGLYDTVRDIAKPSLDDLEDDEFDEDLIEDDVVEEESTETSMVEKYEDSGEDLLEDDSRKHQSSGTMPGLPSATDAMEDFSQQEAAEKYEDSGENLLEDDSEEHRSSDAPADSTPGLPSTTDAMEDFSQETEEEESIEEYAEDSGSLPTSEPEPEFSDIDEKIPEQEPATEQESVIADATVLQQAIEKIQQTIDSAFSANYFEGFQKWLHDRTEDWEKTSLRIGLVGITSAGKSTFINALAGEDILPRGAQPTSGILVVCRKAEKRLLKIVFKEQSEYEFPGEECTPLWVKRYADEAENPNNEQNVAEMHLYLPGLAIPEKYDLIDSPGLDAFGLKGHEELTLRTLIPLVDVVLFLTTTKSTSDKENLKALAKICKEQKPAVVVQTHKDAVEPRYMKGGKILETAEEVLEKHYNRVKDLLRQSMSLEYAHIIQVSSIQALNCRMKNPNLVLEDSEEWQESGFGEVVTVLEKLHGKVSQRISERRLGLLLRELQNVLDRVKADYFSARGKEKEAQHYRDMERKKLAELEASIPTEREATFPDTNLFQQQISEVKDFIDKSLEEWKDDQVEDLPTFARDRIKAIENDFFRKADDVEERLNKLAENLSIDLQAIKPETQKEFPNIPELKRFEKMVRVDVLEEVGVAGQVKRLMGKILKKKDWGFKQKTVTETVVDREALKEDMTDYYSIYRVKLSNYLKNWTINWVNSTGTILSAIAQRRDDINTAPVESDPEPYRILLNQLRSIREWIESCLRGTPKQTAGFANVKYKKQKLGVTERSETNFNVLLPLLQASRTVVFTRKTHRFWHIVNQLCKQQEGPKTVLISTAFSSEIADYLTVLGDLSLVEDAEMCSHLITYGEIPFPLSTSGIPVKKFVPGAEDHRERWFVERTRIVLFHDKLLEEPAGCQLFQEILSQVDAVFRTVDLHQIGHDQMRLSKLPVREALEKAKSRLAYIGMGADRLLKGQQFIDAFKSYSALKNPPGFGLLPFALADGEELLTSLLWLASTLKTSASVSDELTAMDILTRTQPEVIAGREAFIRNFFQEVKQFRKEQQF